MQTKTEFQQVQDYLASIGFIASPVLQLLSLIPAHYVDKQGNHVLIASKHVAIFGGCEGQDNLGCICFSYGGKVRRKGCRTVEESKDILKEVFVSRNADTVIQYFKTWSELSQATLKTWKKVL